METGRKTWGIVGSRHYTNFNQFVSHLETVIEEHGMPDKVVSGGAKGADSLAERWAKEHGIEFHAHRPDESKYPTFAKAALARNTLIVNESDLLVAFLARDSRGTYDTINKAEKKKIPCITFDIE